MNAHKNSFILLFVLVFLALDSAPVWAGPGLFTTVTPEKVAKLEALHRQATDLLLKNDFEGSIRVYSDILLLEPDDETAYTALGQIHLVLGQYKKSYEAFQNALHINPDNQVAAVGIQKIMDPDGVEGMISPEQARTENTASAPPSRISAALTTQYMKSAKMAARFSAGRTKKDIPAPAQHVETPPRPSAESTRPGFLNAQRIQMALKNAGFYHGRVNGLIGESTKRAIVSFQKEKKLPATGKITSETWRALSAELY